MVRNLNDGETPSTRISRLNAVKALHAGIEARRTAKPVTVCPFNLNGSLGEQFNGYWWIRGWRRAGENTPVSDAEVPQT